MKYVNRAVMWLVLLLTCTGCGEVNAVSGTVTQAGQPIEAATILFVPKGGTKGPTVSGKIAKGHYRIAAGEGLQNGKYVVKVTLPVTRRRFEAQPKSQPYEFEREIAGGNVQVNLEL